MEIVFETSVNLRAIEQTRSRGKRRMTDSSASNRRRWPGRHTVTDKWRRYFVSSVTPSWFWFSVFWQALWAIVRLMIANIVGKFAQLLQTIGRQRMSEVEQQGRRAVLVYY